MKYGIIIKFSIRLKNDKTHFRYYVASNCLQNMSDMHLTHIAFNPQIKYAFNPYFCEFGISIMGRGMVRGTLRGRVGAGLGVGFGLTKNFYCI